MDDYQNILYAYHNLGIVMNCNWHTASASFNYNFFYIGWADYQENPEYPEYPEYDAACTTIRGPRPDKPCVFPFILNGETKTSCIKGRLRPEPWCATKVDDANGYIRGEWGICGESCNDLGLYQFYLY